jgi:hypothetical protein
MRIIIKPLGAALLLSTIAALLVLAIIGNRRSVATAATLAEMRRRGAEPTLKGTSDALTAAYLKNSDFAAGGETPADWSLGKSSDPRLRLVRDTGDFKKRSCRAAAGDPEWLGQRRPGLRAVAPPADRRIHFERPTR